jgi:predicted RNA-binding Zn-ribbon protein involved in translation (DUF1610 family)
MVVRKVALGILFLFQPSLVSSFTLYELRANTILSTPQTACCFHSGRVLALGAKPKRGNVVDTYQTVSVNCAKCGERLFRYKKKNGTKSNLVKCFVERISEDSAGVLRDQGNQADQYDCPSCQSRFARSAVMRGLPALKMVGGKTRMTKK